MKKQDFIIRPRSNSRSRPESRELETENFNLHQKIVKFIKH